MELSLISLLPLIVFLTFIFIIYKLFFSKEKESFRNRLEANNVLSLKSIICMLILLAVCLFGVFYSINMWRDLPYVITENYPVVEGQVTKKIDIAGRDSHILIEINNNTYTLHGSVDLSVGTKIRIKYLPNTKEICEISWL